MTRPTGRVFVCMSHLLLVIAACAFGLSWLSPHHYPPWPAFHGEWLALSSVFVGLLAASVNYGRQCCVLIPRPAWVTAALVFVLLIQWSVGLQYFAGDVVVATLFLVGAAAAIVLGSNVSTGYRIAPRLIIGATVLIAALSSSAIAVLQWLKFEHALGMLAVQVAVGDRPVGNLGQPNHLATLALLGVVTWRGLQLAKPVHVVADLAITGLLTLALVISQSRAGIVSGMLVTAFMVWKAPADQRRRTILVWGMWLTTLCLGVACLQLSGEMWSTLSARGSLLDVGDRRSLWAVAIAGLVEAPWIGYGFNQTAAASWIGSLAVPTSTYFNYAHNLILDLMLWLGIPLGLVLSCSGIWWFGSRLLRVRSPASVYACAMLIPLVFHSLVEFPFAYAYFLVTAGLMVGIVEAEATPPGQGWRVPVSALRAFAGVSLIAVLYGAYEYLKIESDYRAVRFENLRIGTPQRDHQPPDIYVLTNLGAKLKALRVQPRPDMPADELALLRDTSNRFVHGPLKLRYALALALNGEPLKAQLALLQLKNTHSDKYYQGVRELWAQRTEQYPQLRFALPP